MAKYQNTFQMWRVFNDLFFICSRFLYFYLIKMISLGFVCGRLATVRFTPWERGNHSGDMSVHCVFIPAKSDASTFVHIFVFTSRFFSALSHFCFDRAKSLYQSHILFTLMQVGVPLKCRCFLKRFPLLFFLFTFVCQAKIQKYNITKRIPSTHKVEKNNREFRIPRK